MDSVYGNGVLPRWVSPFRDPWINAYLQLPKAYRSLSRLSSAPGAKAFALRPYQLDRLALDSPFANEFKNKIVVLFLKLISQFCYSVFKVLSQNKLRSLSFPLSKRKGGGLKWTRTTDLALIRRAL